MDRHAHLGDKCTTQWRRAPGRTWPQAIEAAVLTPQVYSAKACPSPQEDLSRKFSRFWIHGGTRPGEHQPAGPLRVSCGTAAARLLRRRVHYAEVCARSRAAKLPLGFPEGWRRDHRHHRGAGEASPGLISDV